MKSKYILVIIVIACGLGYFYYANSNTYNSIPSLDPNTKINIISNVEWDISVTLENKVKDYDGNYWWFPDITWKHGGGNKTYEIKETNKLKISRVKVSMRYSIFDEIPVNAFLELKILKRGKIIFNKLAHDGTYLIWEP